MGLIGDMISEVTLIQFMVLYFCNLVLDYPLQGEFLAKGKSESNYLLWVHSAIWGLGLSIVLLPLGLYTLWKVIMLVVGHFVIDKCKCIGWIDLYEDQLLHFLQVIFCLL